MPYWKNTKKEGKREKVLGQALWYLLSFLTEGGNYSARIQLVYLPFTVKVIVGVAEDHAVHFKVCFVFIQCIFHLIFQTSYVRSLNVINSKLLDTFQLFLNALYDRFPFFFVYSINYSTLSTSLPWKVYAGYLPYRQSKHDFINLSSWFVFLFKK